MTEKTHAQKASSWREAATLVALAALLVTMGFNTVSVRASAKSARDTRRDAEISLLTALSTFLKAGERDLARPSVEPARCDNLDRPLSAANQLRVLATLDGFDYLGV